MHSTNKQNNNMKSQTNNQNSAKVNPIALNSIHAKQDKQDTMQAILFVALFIVPVIIASLIEILTA